jgi:hypothetical protein
VDWLACVEAAVADGDVELTTVLGGQREFSQARLWRGQVLVDWEPDAQAGGCLIRPGVLRRLVALGAHVRTAYERVELRASGRVLTALSSEHAELTQQLGGAERCEMRVTLRFARDRYIGGEEMYAVLDGRRSQSLLRLTANVRSASPRTSPVKK